jgi:hypothetical protein
MKINKSKIRREIGEELAKSFIASGIEFSCYAAVNGYVRPAALNHAKKLLAQGINLSKGNYGFTWVANMADMFETTACQIVHAHFHPETKA